MSEKDMFKDINEKWLSIVTLIIPSAIPLVGMLMFGNLAKKSGLVPNLVEYIKGALMYVITIFIRLTVGATTNAEVFLNLATIKIIILGLFAFAFGTAGGVIFGKVMCKLLKLKAIFYIEKG